jgi:serine/threonine-protein kinase RsbW
MAASLMHINFKSDPLHVRDALKTILLNLKNSGAKANDIATAEIVLAEVLNNIVEHAYEERGDGDIDLRLFETAFGLTCMFSDRGVAMPDAQPPVGKMNNLDCAVDDLPEGGFGWAMLHALTDDLSYTRQNGANLLSFSLPFVGAAVSV